MLKDLKNTFILLVAGILLLLPSMMFQNWLSPGDHGRDLYAAWAVTQGQIPYQDFWWVYGPLMPYYYGLVISLLGPSVLAMLIGMGFLHILAGILVYRTLRHFIPTAMAIGGAFWFWMFFAGFFYTYNHSGGIVLLIAALNGLASYMKQGNDKKLILASICTALLGLVKINFGILTLIVLTLSGLLSAYYLHQDQFKRLKFFLPLSAVMVLCFWGGAHFLFVQGLTMAEIRQCFPYLSSDHPHTARPLSMAWQWLRATLFNTQQGWSNRMMAVLVWLTILRSGQLLIPKHKTPEARRFLIFAATLIIFYAGSFHEFAASGVLYRTVWGQPLTILLIFLIIGTGLKGLTPWIPRLLLITISLLGVFHVQANWLTVRDKATADHYLALPSGGVFLGTTPDWIVTVEATARQLENLLEDGEQFFAIPYDPLYYYLTKRVSPTRQTIFFEHINIPEEQERSIIEELEEKDIRYILVSNRIYSTEPGLGNFGVTYCPILGKYIEENFKDIAIYGNWQDAAGWAWHHGTRILERIN